MTPPISIDGTDITGATIDGTDVQEITVDGDVVFSAFPSNVFEDFESGNVNDWTDTNTPISITTNAINGNFSGTLSGQNSRNNGATYDPSLLSQSVNTMEVAAEYREDTDRDGIAVTVSDANNTGDFMQAAWFSDFGGEAQLFEFQSGSLINSTDSDNGSKFGSLIRIELVYDFVNNSATGTWYENGTQFEQLSLTGITILPNVAGVATFRNNPRVDDFEVNFT